MKKHVCVSVCLYIFCIGLFSTTISLALINVNCCLLTQMTSWTPETWFQIRLNIRGMVYVLRLIITNYLTLVPLGDNNAQ